jgi:indolepyruvate ferredoxin oxidoreductase, beta subunit
MKALRKDPLNLIIAGVGGQGNILASQVVAQAALKEDLHVTIGETYGVSQRGGSVMSHEPLETLQVVMDFGNAEVRVILNPRPVYPIGVLSGDLTYPPIERILDLLKRHVASLRTLPATDIAKEAGEIRAMNLVMVGALAASGLLPMKKASYIEAIQEQFDGQALQINQRAFENGYRANRNAEA